MRLDPTLKLLNQERWVRLRVSLVSCFRTLNRDFSG